MAIASKLKITLFVTLDFNEPSSKFEQSGCHENHGNNFPSNSFNTCARPSRGRDGAERRGSRFQAAKEHHGLGREPVPRQGLLHLPPHGGGHCRGGHGAGFIPRSVDIPLFCIRILTCLATGLTPGHLSPQTFSLPRLGPKLRLLSQRVHNEEGFFVLRGLQPWRYKRLENTIIYTGIASYIGNHRGLQCTDGPVMSEQGLSRARQR